MNANIERRRTYVLLARYTSIIFLLPSTVIGGYFLGRWLDGKLETYPWLTLVLVLMGTVAGFVEVFRLLMRK
ncbi:MAG: AtpZ/AtpI family protein [Acidobacteria bacterium]|nr:MAG: AtpZ/AtpI family protein [Acidobacteriota bacterium]